MRGCWSGGGDPGRSGCGVVLVVTLKRLGTVGERELGMEPVIV